MRTICRCALLIVLAIGVYGASGASADEQQAQIADFYGSYEGATAADDAADASRRDLGVVIRPTNNGFNVTWSTSTRETDRGPARKTYSIDFTRSGREGVFASAMRKDLFGNPVPLDPFKGDPFVWAALRGKTLTVYALLIMEDAGYELQTYDRTLTDEGLHLEFSRIREGLHLKYVTGTLVRTGP
ncbi:MAG: hypothetical protein IPM60_13850 [Rhodospirillales bacterium]|nr:hypothetical protein [Rhodospirillales bacterium]